MTLKEIQRTPTTLEKIHESVYRSYHILEQVLKMVERRDSKETIFEVVGFCIQNIKYRFLLYAFILGI